MWLACFAEIFIILITLFGRRCLFRFRGLFLLAYRRILLKIKMRFEATSFLALLIHDILFCLFSQFIIPILLEYLILL